ncbi:MAG: hypothetical protein A2017_12515 [Lentisphaerae bacterium GWF2_44_16]|nr:MAG: hypothetical protein A2017_12515 [Lentisphaerae bacterium GWF2_44_16]
MRIDIKNGNMKIIAASRRNPPLSPLDNCPVWLPVTLACSDNGILVSCIVSGDTGHWNSSFYQLDIEKNKWTCNYKRKGVGVINAEYFIRDLKYPVFNTSDGTLKQFNIGWLFVEMVGRNMQAPEYSNFMNSKTVVGNETKIFRILQLDGTAFDIKALDTGDRKISGQTFRVDSKSFSPEYKYMIGSAVSDKLIYILMSQSKSDFPSSICILALEQDKILKPVDMGTLKIKKSPVKIKEYEALPEPLPALKPGIKLNFYKGAWRSAVNYIPDTLLMVPFSNRIVNSMKVSGFEWNEDAIFTLRGYLKIEKEGKYSFSINNKKVNFKVHIDTLKDNDRRNIRDVILKPGLHSVRIDIFAKGYQKDIEILIKPPGEEKYKTADEMLFYNPDEK